MSAFHQKVVPYFRLYSIEYKCFNSLLDTSVTLQYRRCVLCQLSDKLHTQQTGNKKIATRLRKFYPIFAIGKYKITEYHQTL